MAEYKVLLTSLMLLLLAAAPVRAADRFVAPLDLTRHVKTDKELHLKKIDEGAYEWTLPRGKRKSLLFDLEKLDIDPARYDEIRFEIKSTVSQVRTHWVLHGHLDPGQLSSWYLKFKTPTGEWREGRYSLHLDDDGVYLSKGKNPNEIPKWLKITLSPRILGYPGEPKRRRAIIRNVRFVRHRVSADFRLDETEIETNDAGVSYRYKLHLHNQTDQEQRVKFDLDSTNSLHYFSASGPESLSLTGGEQHTVPVRVFMPRQEAMKRAPLYSEPLFPKVYVPGQEDSDVVPLRGYRKWPIWGTVPLFNAHSWRPTEFQAYLDARAKAMPGIGAWKNKVVKAAKGAMKHDWPIPDFGPPEHNLSYRCAECKVWLKPATPTSLHKHVCPKCEKIFDHDEDMDRAYLLNYHSGRAKNVKNLALAWLMTGQQEYAQKAKKMLLKYAAGYPEMPSHGTRSTAAGARLGWTTLHASYVIPVFSEGYYFLREAPLLDDVSRSRIEGFLLAAGRTVVQHSVEYSNQQSEHLRAYGTAGLATRFWPLAAEAIHGEFGYHEVVEYGFSEDGIAPEAGAYHRASFGALNHLAEFGYSLGLNLYTPRFKRVFEGSIAAGLGGASYETAYRAYRDPSFLRRLTARDSKNIKLDAILHGVLGVPDAEEMPIRSQHLTGAGYVFLRKGNAGDYREIRLNYIKQFDRTEHDRLTTFFYKNGQQVDDTVGRIGYASPHSKWMYHPAAHNCIVVDGQTQHAQRGRLIAFEPSPAHPVAVAGNDPETPFYPGVTQLRCIALLGESYVVFDHVRADAPRTIDRYQYGKGKAKLHIDDAQKVDGQVSDLPEEGEFHEIQGGRCGQSLRIEYGNGLKMRLVSDGTMEAYKAITQGGYQARPMEVTFARRSKTKTATFLAGFSFGEQSEPLDLKILRSNANDMAFEVQTGDKTYVVTIRPRDGEVAVE